MADTYYGFDSKPAVTPDGELLDQGTEGQIYGSQADAEAGTNPLALEEYGSPGTPRSSTIKVSSISLWEAFRAPAMKVWWKSGDIIQPIYSDDAVVKNATAADDAAAAQAAAEDARDDAKSAKQSALNSAQAAQAAADTASRPANAAIDAYLAPDGGTAEGLVGRVSDLEAGGGTGGAAGGLAMIAVNGQLPVSWDSNMQPTYGDGTPMRPTASRNVQIPWLLDDQIDLDDVPIIDSGTGGFMRGVDIMQVPA